MTKKATQATGVDTSKDKDPLIGKQLGDYRLTSVLATGGMARIYKGMDYKLQRQAAVKVLAQDEIEGDKTLMKRFQREARAVAALEHDNIITIYQYGEQEGVYFLAMKLIKGKDLAQELKRLKKANQKMDIKRALGIMDQVASALDAAHAADVVHRDIKPSNILLDDDDKAVLTDFGLVLRPSVETTMGTAFGTPRYIAPEQAISSNKALPQSDIYSLGIIVYEILCGDTPFSGESPMEIALSHISDPPPVPRSLNKDIPVAVEREVLKALEKEPEKRHRSASEFVDSVRQAYGNMVDAPSAPKSASGKAKAKAQAQIAAASDSWTLSDANDSVAKARSKLQASIKTEGKIQGRSRSRLPLLILAVIALVAVSVFLLVNKGTGIAAGDGAPITLFYNDTSFTMVNAGTYTLNVNDLKFVRGVADAGGDDYNGYRIAKRVLPSNSCARIVLQGKQSDAPPQCKAIQSSEFLSNQMLFFWRKEAEGGNTVSSFDVSYKGTVIANCNTVARGGDAECRFTWPVSAPTPEPAT
ncbi:MAG: serine/threonine-protein kinase [Chloroflexota bacterium]